MKPEVRRVAHKLGIDPSDVAYLAAVPDDDLDAFGRAVDDFMLELAREGSIGVGRLARAIPVSAAAKVAARLDSPLVVARLAFFNDGDWAAKMAQKLSPELLARSVTHLDAGVTARIVDTLSEQRQAEVLAILLDREQWVALGDIFGQLSAETARRWAAQAGSERFAEILQMVPAARKRAVEVATA